MRSYFPRRGVTTSSSAVEDEVVERRPDDRQVGRHGLVTDGVQVVLQLHVGVLLRGAVAILHLRPASEAGTNEITRRVERQAFLQLSRVHHLLRPWADDRQVADEDV